VNSLIKNVAVLPKELINNKKILSGKQFMIAKILLKEGLLHGSPNFITFTRLGGGVSSDIFLVTDGMQKLVVKQALRKLRVKDDWYADIGRNRSEYYYLKYVSGIDQNVVPKVLYYNQEKEFFVMEYLAGFSTWKSELMAKKISKEYAKKAGEILGNIHRLSWNNIELLQQFDTTKLFIQLRVDPYLYTTGKRIPKLYPLFEHEGQRLIANRKCLVHGDYSPKNLLVKDGKLVIIDCEVAWYGDPTFDIAFLLNHLFLKAVYNNDIADKYMNLANIFWESYANAVEENQIYEIERYIGRLLLMLMLARIKGKSPVEYLNDKRKKSLVKSFVMMHINEDLSIDPVKKLSNDWKEYIFKHYAESC